MANIKFRLRTPKLKNKLQSIQVIYSFGSNDKFVFSTGIKTTPKDWNSKKQIISVGNKKNHEINNLLTDLKSVVEEKIYNHVIKNKEILTKSILKDFLKEYFNPHKQKKTDKLLSFIELFIKNSQNSISSFTGKIIAKGTYDNYIQTFKWLQKFEKEKNIILYFDNIDLNFYKDYVNFLQSKNFATNTIAKNLKGLRTFLNSATEKGINTNMTYKKPFFKIITEKTESIYLNEKELKQIYNYDFSENKKLEKVRDLFIIGCWTGLRFSDYKKIDIKDVNLINEIEILTVVTEKTKQIVKIPLKKEVKDILNKYEGKAPQDVTNLKFNEYIKEVCRIVGINENIKKTITRGGVLQIETYPKYKLVGSHTARRSFATNLYKNNFPAISIMQITGHTTEQSFLSYIKVTKEEHAQLLANHWNNFNKI